MIMAVVIVVVIGLALAVVVAIARDKGPGPGDVAVAYELAWDHLDFESLFSLSANELRDGLDRHGFVAAKRTAYEQQHALGGLVARVGIDEVASSRDAAVVDHAGRAARRRCGAQPGRAGAPQHPLGGRGLPARAVRRGHLARQRLTACGCCGGTARV